jgi:hypothetical protein
MSDKESDMPVAVRKSIRIPGDLLQSIEALNEEGDQFSTIVQRALRRWVRYQRRKAYGQLVRQAAQQRTPEQSAEEEQLIGRASQAGLEALREEQRGG